MAKGICVYAEQYQGKLEPVAAELVTAAKLLAKETEEPVCAVTVGTDCQGVIRELQSIGVDEIYVVETEKNLLLQDDAASAVYAEMLRRIEPSAVLIGATPSGRSIFSRVAVKLGCGMTADCTELLVGTKEDGSKFIKQNKPSFGNNVFVTIVTKEGYAPQMMTVRPGVYQAAEAAEETDSKIVIFDNIEIPASEIEVLSVEEAENVTDSITGAEIVVVGGRGAMEEETFALLTEFADKIGAAVAGTRPIVDSEQIPFNHQIGQTGLTIRPKVCISCGVSGAIQHTEGIKDTKLYIAINTDPDAAIYAQADYGMAADCKEVLKAYLGTMGSV